MLEDRYLLAVTLLVPDEVGPDGEVAFREHPGRALLLESVERAAGLPALQEGTTFLLRCDARPEPGGRIVFDGRLYEIRQVRVCRGLDGRIECYRCTVV